MFAALVFITVLAADPFQEQVNQQNQAAAVAAAKEKASKRQEELDNSATPDAETAAKMESRKWHGLWHDANPSHERRDVNGKLVRVYRVPIRNSRHKGLRIESVEIQSPDGTLWRCRDFFSLADKDSAAYVRTFMADWEKKHAEKK